MIRPNSNPGLWYVQEPVEEKDNFWDWWEDNGSSATNLANSVLCTIFPNRAGCQPNEPTPRYLEQDQTMLYVLLGIILILILILIVK
jgi:hypothetical protein